MKNKIYHSPTRARRALAFRKRAGQAYAAGNLHAQAAGARLRLNSLGQNAYLSTNAIKGGASIIDLMARPQVFPGSPF